MSSLETYRKQAKQLLRWHRDSRCSRARIKPNVPPRHTTPTYNPKEPRR